MILYREIHHTQIQSNSIHRLKKAIIVLILGLISVVILNCSDPLVFSVMGDIPRSNDEKIILKEQIIKHNKLSQSQFVFHVGDIKSGDSLCPEDNYALVAKYLKQLTVPVFIIPGDNEWNDCENPNRAWNFWNKYFISFDQNWEVPFNILRQENYLVNIAFVKNNVLFIALNLVGGRIHDQVEWDLMQQNAIDWIEQQLGHKGISAAVILAQANLDDKHKLFTGHFLKLVKNFEKQVLFIHGDGHIWLHEDPWLVQNLVRIQVDKGGIADPLQVTISGNTTKNFKFERYPFVDKE